MRRPALGERRPLVDGRAHERVAQLEGHPAHADEPGALGRRRGPRRRRPAAPRRRGPSSRSPLSSVAATSSSRWLAGGSPRTRSRNARSRCELMGSGPRIGSTPRGLPLGRAPPRTRAARAGCPASLRPATRRRRAPARRRSRARRSRGRTRASTPPSRSSAISGASRRSRRAPRGRRGAWRSVRLQAPGDEEQRVGRRFVEPLRIVDEAQQRPALGGLGEDAQHGQRDQEGLGTRAELEPERAAQRAGPGCREPPRRGRARASAADAARRRAAGLGFGAVAGEDLHVGGAQAGLVEQGGLADAGRAAEQEDGALRAAGAAQQSVEAIELVAPAVNAVDRVVTVRGARARRPGGAWRLLGCGGLVSAR